MKLQMRIRAGVGIGALTGGEVVLLSGPGEAGGSHEGADVDAFQRGEEQSSELHNRSETQMVVQNCKSAVATSHSTRSTTPSLFRSKS